MILSLQIEAKKEQLIEKCDNVTSQVRDCRTSFTPNLSMEKRETSQLEGPTPSNSFGFKVSESALLGSHDLHEVKSSFYPASLELLLFFFFSPNLFSPNPVLPLSFLPSPLLPLPSTYGY